MKNVDRVSQTVACLPLTPVQIGWPLHPVKNSWGTFQCNKAFSKSGGLKRHFKSINSGRDTKGLFLCEEQGRQFSSTERQEYQAHLMSLHLTLIPCILSPAKYHSSHRVRWRDTWGTTCPLAAFSASLSLKMWKTWVTTSWSTGICQPALKVNRLGFMLHNCTNLGCL